MASQNSQNSFHTAQGSQTQNVNVEPIVANYNENLASDHDFIKLMYNIVKASGTTDNPVFLSKNITVTGGAAYCIYRTQYLSLQPMLTRDIDMVWWTLNQVEKQTIVDLIDEFRKKLNLLCETIEIQTLLKEFVRKFHPESILKVEIKVSEPIHFPQEGPIINSNLHLSILIDGTHLVENICELSIHNGISSQRFNMNHTNLKRINLPPSVKLATADPIYCDHTENSTEMIYETRVPTIGRYVIQQLFAYKNLRIFADAITIPKSHIRLYRVLNFCLLGDQELISFIDIILSRSVIAVITNLTKIKRIQDSYIAEVEKDLNDLHILMELQYPILFPITYTKLKNEQQRLHMEYLRREREEEHQRRKGGFLKKRTIKRKKNKSKTKKRSTR